LLDANVAALGSVHQQLQQQQQRATLWMLHRLRLVGPTATVKLWPSPSASPAPGSARQQQHLWPSRGASSGHGSARQPGQQQHVRHLCSSHQGHPVMMVPLVGVMRGPSLAQAVTHSMQGVRRHLLQLALLLLLQVRRGLGKWHRLSCVFDL
jgi:hypothetical protein